MTEPYLLSIVEMLLITLANPNDEHICAMFERSCKVEGCDTQAKVSDVFGIFVVLLVILAVKTANIGFTLLAGKLLDLVVIDLTFNVTTARKKIFGLGLVLVKLVLTVLCSE